MSTPPFRSHPLSLPGLVLPAMFLLLPTLRQAAAAPPIGEWVARFRPQGSVDNRVIASAIDAGGNIYVSGFTLNSDTAHDAVLLKFDPAGNELWRAVFDHTAHKSDIPVDLVVSPNGNIHVAVLSFANNSSYDYLVLTYNSDGVLQWSRRFNSSGANIDRPFAVAVDALGAVYVTGASPMGNRADTDFLTIKYDSGGAQVWQRRYDDGNRSNEGAQGLAVSPMGEVYVTGTIIFANGSLNWLTLKYDAAGTLQWASQYDGTASGNDDAIDVGLDASGNVHVSGSSTGIGTGSDITLVRYRPADGAALSEFRLDGPDHLNDRPSDVLILPDGSALLTGQTTTAAGQPAVITARVDAAGHLEWSAVEVAQASGGASGSSVGVAPDGRVFVAGSAFGTASARDMRTYTYSPDGQLLLERRYSGPSTDEDLAVNVHPDGQSGIYVAGNSGGSITLLHYLQEFSPPASPSELTGRPISRSAIRLDWRDESDIESGVRIERSDDGGTTFLEIGDVPTDTVTFTDSGLESNTRYYYRVQSYNAAGASAYTEAIAVDTPDPSIPPPTPEDLSATAVTPDLVRVTWSDVAITEDGYTLERSTDDGSTWNRVVDLPENSVLYDDTARGSTTYQYRLRAYNRGGMSDYAGPVEVRTPLGLDALILLRSTVKGGKKAKGTISITEPAPNGGITVTIASDKKYAKPKSKQVFIPRGETTAKFVIKTKRVKKTKTANISGTLGGSLRAQMLTIKGKKK